MTIIQSTLLGIIQGLTEFLPVSSSGHLVLAKALMNIHTGNDISFEVFVHFGTLMSLLFAFRDDLVKLAGAVASCLKEPGKISAHYRESEYFRLAVLIMVASLPAGTFGLLFNDRVEAMFDSPQLAAGMLLVTGVILFSTKFVKPGRSRDMTLRRSIGIGIAQAVAIVPGISRSGSTIASGVLFGLSQERAAQFSFLMAVPVILGATLLKARHLLIDPPPSDQLQTLAAGTAAAAVMGYVALRFFLQVLRAGKLASFSYYCLAAGLLGILLFM